MKSIHAVRTLLACALLVTQAPSFAQDNFPNKPVKVIVPFPPGGGVDVIARMVGNKLSTDWGQPVVMDNKPGAGTLIGAHAVATAPADGYTLLAATADTLAVAAALQSKPITLPEKTLLPLTQIVRTPLLIAVKMDSPYKNLSDFIEAARKNPGRLSYGSAGIGTIHHMSMEGLAEQAKVDIKHVAYRGSGPAVADLLAGVIDVAMLESPTALPQIKGSKLRALGISTPARAAVAPDVPTIAEQGYPNFSAISWMGFAVARGTPPAIVEKLFAGIRDAIESPDVAQKLRGMGLEPVTSKSTAEFERFAETERVRWAALIKAKNIHVD
ncbi:Bug family tripartite tricarboxylate transporter substrate binding protein [Ottowia thiooxydans]|uniref:Bug family tripartite tricarboxylate transporter substrate binding protein n=1 Tax=Ottowia thiooxydans TaxID=219182 RepID=UPI0004116162|nr:tripartite tricarboxylate transporter substrate binding protein [Ottowia thiooxydans]